jgi:hypothetical protein
MKHQWLNIILMLTVMTFATAGRTDDQLMSGTVVEHIDVAAYSYLKVQSEDDEQWIAIVKEPVGEGDLVQFSGGLEMTDFYSETLDRSFASILFVTRATVVRSGDSGAEEFKHPGTSGTAAVNSAAQEVPKIEALEAGLTVHEILSQSKAFKGQDVSLRARVMKVNEAIMGKNWVTLQDGTGTEPDNKLIATTQDVVSVGDTVVVTGVIANDVSLGYGYDYEVLLEEATFITETGGD